jgi:hypothetical protein
MLSNKGYKSMFIKLVVYFYTMMQLLIKLILMGLIIYFRFEAQINYMWWLENFKVNKILHVTIFYTFYTICSPNFIATKPTNTNDKRIGLNLNQKHKTKGLRQEHKC